MQKNQYIVIGLALVLVISLYFYGVRKGDPVKKGNHTNQKADGQNASEPGSIVEAINFDDYAQDANSKLNEKDKLQAKNLLDQVSKNQSPVTFKNLAEFWEQHKDLNMAANYYKKAAFLENTEKSITFAGNLFLAVMQKTDRPELRKWQALEAIGCFNKALEINPENVETKIALAICYTEGTGETMKGVTLLRDITQKDSNNISANIILGKLAIQSGQLDKAIRRLELVLTLRPENTEAMYFLAEAYKGKGNKEKAIELFEKCKKIVNNPDFTQEIDTYINSFK